jgi:hypothetical protein
MQNLGSNADFKYYGIVETVGGFLKVCLVLGASILSYVIAAKRMYPGVILIWLRKRG